MESGRLFFNRSGDYDIQGSRTMMISMEEGSRIGPFFSSPDDLFDDDDQSPDKKRRLSSDQVHMLEKSFDRENKLKPERKTQLAKKLGLEPRQVSVWFQNRRARSKTKQLERDYDLLKASYDSLVSDFDSMVKQNDLLKSEVISLIEKLQGKEVSEMVLPGSGQNCDILDDVSAQLSIKVEDRPSSGTSTVVDEEGPQFVDNGDSYFPDEDYPAGCVDPVDSIHSEVEALHWWVWS